VIRRRVAQLGSQIRRDAGEVEIALIGILKGSAVFFADLLRAIPGQVRYEFVDVVRDEADTGPSALEIDFFSHFDMRGRNIYLLKDVVTTGVIENYLLTQFRTKEPRTLKLVALLDRKDLRTVLLEVDYRAFEATSGIYVGYGLEHGGRHGNLPYIGMV
jgi:hypoxanthine phosphoribosyltransferase